jgi:hypothetical protein
MLHAELPGFADKGNVFSGPISLNMTEKRLKTAIDRNLIEDRLGSRRDSLYRSRGKSGGIRECCRSGLADCRHTSL